MIKNLGLFGDNGSSGSFCIMEMDTGNVLSYFHTPIIKEQDYTKKEKYISRLDHKKFEECLCSYPIERYLFCYLERPMISNFRFKLSIIAARCFEATLIIIEQLGIGPIKIIDSKQWQLIMLPGIKGKDELKEASDNYCKSHYPEISLSRKGKKEQDIKTKPGRGDSILIAEWARRNWLSGLQTNK